DEILPLIFSSGISTSDIITDISGRGLGLSIVREKVEKLNGKITVESTPVSGTVFHILLPLSLAIFRSLMVRCGGSYFMIPSANVERVLRAGQHDIALVGNRETIRFEGQILRIADLGDVLELPEQKSPDGENNPHVPAKTDNVKLVVLTSGENRIAFRVDEVYDEKQILVKGLGKILKRVRHISGATFLGTGKIVPVLNVGDLMKSGLKKPAVTVSRDEAPKAKKILIAEDSVTARALLKNILETAGYSVTTAVDGKEAFDKAQEGGYDLVVSDIDMPGMNGFELTSMIRGDNGLSETPVVLVTALESREDKEKGIEAGADAYIVKSSFDQDNLLAIIEQLV
ncbi:MAG: response regulator, partial [Bacteroidales bacterium]